MNVSIPVCSRYRERRKHLTNVLCSFLSASRCYHCSASISVVVSQWYMPSSKAALRQIMWIMHVPPPLHARKQYVLAELNKKSIDSQHSTSNPHTLSSSSNFSTNRSKVAHSSSAQHED
jgi:hypothetical protein